MTMTRDDYGHTLYVYVVQCQHAEEKSWHAYSMKGMHRNDTNCRPQAGLAQGFQTPPPPLSPPPPAPPGAVHVSNFVLPALPKPARTRINHVLCCSGCLARNTMVHVRDILLCYALPGKEIAGETGRECVWSIALHSDCCRVND